MDRLRSQNKKKLSNLQTYSRLLELPEVKDQENEDLKNITEVKRVYFYIKGDQEIYKECKKEYKFID